MGGRAAVQQYRSTCVLLLGALLAALLGGVGGLDAPSADRGWQAVETLGLLLVALLLPVTAVLTVRARRLGVPVAWRAAACVLLLAALLLPALVLASTAITPRGFEDLVRCDAVLQRDAPGSGDAERDAFVRQVCEPARAARAGQAGVVCVAAVVVAGALAIAALRPVRTVEASR